MDPLLETESSSCLVSWLKDTHALVHFQDEETSSIVPLKRVDKMDGMRIGDTCFVVWSDKKRYKGTLIFSGTLEDCAAEQDIFEGSDNESVAVDEVIDEPKKMPKRRKLGEKNSSNQKKKRKRKLIAKTSNGKENSMLSSKSQDKQQKIKDKSKKEFNIWVGETPPGPDVSSATPHQGSAENKVEEGSSKGGYSSELSSSSDENEDDEEIYRVPVDNVKGDHSSTPIHYIEGLKKTNCLTRMYGELGELKKDVVRIAEEQNLKLTQIEQQLQEVGKQVKSLSATNVTSRLLPHQSNMMIPPVKVPSSCNPASVMMPPANIPSSCNPESMTMPPAKVPSSCNPVSVMMPPANIPSSCTPESVTMPPAKVPSSCNPVSVMMPPANIPSSCDPESVMMPPVNIPTSCNPAIPANSLMPYTPNSSSSSLMIAELSDSFDSSFLSDSSIDLTIPNDSEDMHYKRELLSSAEITPIYVKSRNRNNFAALLVERLFDVETRLKSNVAGRGKEKLDPEVIKYIKCKVFQFYECNVSEIKDKWKKCIKSIDDKSRALKKRKTVC